MQDINGNNQWDVSLVFMENDTSSKQQSSGTRYDSDADGIHGNEAEDT